MTIDKLFGNLSASEREIFHLSKEELSSYSPALSGEQIYSYELFDRLMNHERYLKEIESDPYEIFNWLPNEFKPFEDFVQKRSVSLEEIEPYYNRIQSLLENMKKYLAIKMRTPSVTSKDPLIIYYRIYYNFVSYLDENIVAQWKVLNDKKASLNEISKYFNLDLPGHQFVQKFNFDPEKIWLDLPPSHFYFDDDFSKVKAQLSTQTFSHDVEESLAYIEALEAKSLPIQLDSIKRLKKAMEQYDKLEKTDPVLLKKRISILNDISARALFAIENESKLSENQKMTLREITHQARSKSHYLSEVSKIPLKANHRAYRTEHVGGKPLVVDKIEWFEDLDPAHREHNKELYERWLNEALLNEKTPNYWLWLEGLDPLTLSQFEIDERYTVPLDEKLVRFNEGLCYNPKCSKVESGLIADGIYLYNIDKNNDLYILPSPRNYPGRGPWAQVLHGQGVKDAKRNFNHNSVLNGENVKCAGCIFIKDGKIVQMDTNSGHYKPKMAHLREAIQDSLLSKSIFSEDAVIANFDGDSAVPIKDFISDRFDIKAHFPKEHEALSQEELARLRSEAPQTIASKLSGNAQKENLKRKLLVWAKSINQEAQVDSSSTQVKKDGKKLNP